MADVHYPELRIIELGNRKLVASWIIPPPISFLWETALHWSPDSRTVSVGNLIISDTGLWIYDLDTCTALSALNNPVAAMPKSPDGKRLAVSVSLPILEIWIADADPNRPTAQALGTAMTVQEHCLKVMESCDRHLEMNPNSLEDHLQRTASALWIGHDRATVYLREMNHALDRVSYPGGECNVRAWAVLSSLSPARGRFLPLAELLAREAVKKQPEQTRLFAWMFHRSGYPEQASSMLQACSDAPRGSSRYDSLTDNYTIGMIYFANPHHPNATSYLRP